jgi:ankyrin repeat protein
MNYRISNTISKLLTQYLLFFSDPRIDLSDGRWRALQCACSEGHKEIVKLLLQDKRTDPSANASYALRIASLHGHKEIVKMLLQDKRVDPSDSDNGAIKWANEQGYDEILDMLINAVSDIHFQIFAQRKRKEIAKALMKKKRTTEETRLDPVSAHAN